MVVPDSLHLFLRISDQLIVQLIQNLKRADNIEKNVDKNRCQHMLRFEKFVASLCIPWSIYTNRDTGLFQYRDFTRPEHRKIQQHIKLDDIIPNHPKLESIKYLWAKFSEIMSLLKADNVDPKFFERQARSWVAKYSSTFQLKDVTPYTVHACVYEPSVRIS